MAYLLGCENVHLEYPTKKVAGSVTLGINKGDRVGIVGGNGDGKSTLLSLLAGSVTPDDGRIMRRGGTTISTLEQTDSPTPRRRSPLRSSETRPSTHGRQTPGSGPPSAA